MKLIRGRSDARWLPSRHNYALFRFFGYLRLRSSSADPADVILPIHPHQSAAETYIVGAWYTGTITCYLASALFDSWPLALALAVSLPLAIVSLHLPLFFSGLVVAPLWGVVSRARSDRHERINSVVFMLVLFAGAGWAVTRPGWVRLAGWQVLALAVLNSLAAFAVWLLRDDIGRLELALGGSPSAS